MPHQTYVHVRTCTYMYVCMYAADKHTHSDRLSLLREDHALKLLKALLQFVMKAVETWVDPLLVHVKGSLQDVGLFGTEYCYNST